MSQNKKTTFRQRMKKRVTWGAIYRMFMSEHQGDSKVGKVVLVGSGELCNLAGFEWDTPVGGI